MFESADSDESSYSDDDDDDNDDDDDDDDDNHNNEDGKKQTATRLSEDDASSAATKIEHFLPKDCQLLFDVSKPFQLPFHVQYQTDAIANGILPFYG